VSDLDRRDALKLIAAGGASAALGCRPGHKIDPVVGTRPLRTPWPTLDPFLFCVHHDDAYPAGDARFGPAAPLDGRRLGNDFAGKDGWRMYHGRVVPGFPQHPHRGFETVTVVRHGLLDHADSLGAAARYGGGDVQWLTAGAGILHAEMFPLLDRARPNPVELFQIWLNLPRVDKFADPHFSMLWRDLIPRHTVRDAAGRAVDLTVIAGDLAPVAAPPPPPRSWAARADTDVAIWTIKLAPGARWSLPRAAPTSNRMLYFFRGERLRLAGAIMPAGHAIELRAGVDVLLEAGDEVELLLLQGRPIDEPVVAQGPFVMNTRDEIGDAIADYRRTRFGGWPWPSDDHVHGPDPARFARHADGRTERPA
jgi:quercetin 2,3-dioxygenase